VELVRGLAVDLPAGEAGITLVRVALAPGAGLERHRVAGAELAIVEAGHLAVTGEDGSVSIEADGRGVTAGGSIALGAGGAVLVEAGTIAYRNIGDDPLSLLLVVIAGSSADTAATPEGAARPGPRGGAGSDGERTGTAAAAAGAPVGRTGSFPQRLRTESSWSCGRRSPLRSFGGHRFGGRHRGGDAGGATSGGGLTVTANFIKRQVRSGKQSVT
jgi:hypothetical protein